MGHRRSNFHSWWYKTQTLVSWSLLQVNYHKSPYYNIMGFVCLRTPRPFTGPWVSNLAVMQMSCAVSQYDYQFGSRWEPHWQGATGLHFKDIIRCCSNSGLLCHQSHLVPSIIMIYLIHPIHILYFKEWKGHRCHKSRKNKWLGFTCKTQLHWSPLVCSWNDGDIQMSNGSSCMKSQLSC